MSSQLILVKNAATTGTAGTSSLEDTHMRSRASILRSSLTAEKEEGFKKNKIVGGGGDSFIDSDEPSILIYDGVSETIAAR